jgi:hypothetical protein
MVWLKEDLVDGWKKIWWMIGRISEWMVRRRSGGWLVVDIVDGWKKIL